MARKIFLVSLFSISFAFVEAAIVVYLRSIYYPEGFSFPLKLISPSHLPVELARELSTIVMLAAVGILAGTTRWSRFAFFAIAFGVWDIFYYVWLKVTLDWPASLFDWDVLFLIPVPWIGPVLAPVVISFLLIASGLMILRRESSGAVFKPGRLAWALAILGTAVILFTFVWDFDATLRFQMPQPYRYDIFSFGVVCYVGALVAAGKSAGR
ncbi:MAG TPA: hypothetical protein VNL36_10730 [Bacteroidota bacterium]|nr:hypothetical protein [Bacteroidota bacterium]